MTMVRLLLSFVYWLFFPLTILISGVFLFFLLTIFLIFIANQHASQPHQKIFVQSPINPPFLDQNDYLSDYRNEVRELLSTYPSSRDLWLYYGWISVSLNDFVGISDSMTSLNEIDPNNPEIKPLQSIVSE